MATASKQPCVLSGPVLSCRVRCWAKAGGSMSVHVEREAGYFSLVEASVDDDENGMI